MIIQIDRLFVNTDTITTISTYVKKLDDTISEFGFTINGVNYIIISCKTEDKEECEKALHLCENIVSTIISKIVTPSPVQRLNLFEEKENSDGE